MASKKMAKPGKRGLRKGKKIEPTKNLAVEMFLKLKT